MLALGWVQGAEVQGPTLDDSVYQDEDKGDREVSGEVTKGLLEKRGLQGAIA